MLAGPRRRGRGSACARKPLLPVGEVAIQAVHLLPLVALAALVPALRPRDAEAPRQEQAGPGLRLAAAEAFQGYTLIAPLSSRWTYLLDMQGRAVHRWESRFAPGNAVHLLDDGSILRCGRDGETSAFAGGGQGGYVERIAWDGTLIWTLDWSDERHLQHHDALPLSNGNVILIAWERKTREEALAAGRDPGRVGDDGLWPDYLVEIEPVLPEGGRVVWEWHAWDHMIQDFDPMCAHYGDVTAHPERIDINADHRLEPPLSSEERRRREEEERRMRALGYVGDGPGEYAAPRGGARWDRADWLHTNSVALHLEHDLLLLSVLRLSEIWVIDHSTTSEEARGSRGGRWGRGGGLLYRWGNPRSYGAAGEQALFAQHDAHWIPEGLPGAGRVLLFNNGGGAPGRRPFDRRRAGPALRPRARLRARAGPRFRAARARLASRRAERTLVLLLLLPLRRPAPAERQHPRLLGSRGARVRGDAGIPRRMGLPQSLRRRRPRAGRAAGAGRGGRADRRTPGPGARRGPRPVPRHAHRPGPPRPPWPRARGAIGGPVPARRKDSLRTRRLGRWTLEGGAYAPGRMPRTSDRAPNGLLDRTRPGHVHRDRGEAPHTVQPT